MATSYMAFFEGYSQFSIMAMAIATGYTGFLKVYGQNLNWPRPWLQATWNFLRVILDFQTLEILKSLERVE